MNGSGAPAMENGEKLKNAKEKPEENSETEGAWAWVVFMATILNSMIFFGQFTSGPIYYVIFLNEFQMSQSYTAWILAAQSAAFCAGGPISSFLLSKIGPRGIIFTGAILYSICLLLCYFANSIPFLILTFSVSGIACSLVHTGNVAAITTYFNKRAYTILGLMLAGSGLGGMLFSIEVEWAVDTFGWRGAMLIQSGIVMHIFIGGAVVFNKKAIKSETNNENKKIDEKKEHNWNTLMTYLSDVRLWLIIISMLMMNLTLSTMLPFMKNIVLHKGLGESTFKYVVISYGVGGSIGRGVVGSFAQRLCPPITALIASFMGGIANLLYIWANDFWSMIVVVFAFGLFIGATTVVSLLQIGWVYGSKNMASISGYTFIFCLISTFAGAPVAGYSVDVTNSYTITILMCSISSILGAASSLLLYVIHRRHLSVLKPVH